MYSLQNNRGRIELCASWRELQHTIKFLEEARYFYDNTNISIKFCVLCSLLMIRKCHNSYSCYIRSNAFSFVFICSKMH